MITLSEYLGFVFSEITRARGSADRVSAEIAQAYAADPIMKHFSVPRFKIPEMTVTIPMVVSGAKFSSILKFNAEPAEFSDFVTAEIGRAILKVYNTAPHSGGDLADIIKEFFHWPHSPSGAVRAPAAATRKSKTKAIQQAVSVLPDVSDFYNLVTSNLDLNQADKIVEMKYAEIFQNRFAAKRLTNDYKRLYPNDELFVATLAKVQDFVLRHTIVDRVKMENLLVNPETNMVKTLGNDSSILTIMAKISEEGVFVKTLKDRNGQVTSSEVEFE